MIHIERARKHVYDVHMKPVLMRSVETDSVLVDPSGRPISKTVLEPYNEE